MNKKTALGCLVGALVLISVPMWLTLLFVVLDGVGAPAWAWGIYFAYVPVSMASGLIHVAANAIEE